jgi:cytochrome c peroxidase
MHDGGKETLEQVILFYDRGGNANEFLDPLLRDLPAERAYEISRRDKTPYEGPEVKLCGKDQKPIVRLALGLEPQQRKDLALFLRALQGDPVDPLVADREKMPGTRLAP